MTGENLKSVPYEQRIDALGKANRIRIYRTNIRRCLRNRRCQISREMLDDPDLQGMKIWDLIISQYSWGTTRTGRLLGRMMISGERRLRQITPRQKTELAKAVRRPN